MKLKRIYFALIIGFHWICCYANKKEANHFLDMLRETDGKGENVETILGPNPPVNLSSALSDLKKSTGFIEIGPELLSWASSGNKVRDFKNNQINDFFKTLFHLIEKRFPDITLDRVNLFHAHLIQSRDDFILVFHAFEYPIDLEPINFFLAQNLDPRIVAFTTDMESYKRRNLLWSLKKNKIWRFDTSLKSKFNFLIRSPAYPLYPEEVISANTLQENFFGNSIADLNFFPLEGNNLFLNIFYHP